MPIIKTIFSRSIELEKYRDSTIACKIISFEPNLNYLNYAKLLKISCFIKKFQASYNRMYNNLQNADL